MTMPDDFKKQQSLITINWEGSLFCHHSLAMVNREFLTELSYSNKLDIKHVPYEPDQFIPDQNSKYSRIKPMLSGLHNNPDIYLRHRWPPDFNRPKCEKFILIQPWEYGSLPTEWRDCMNSVVDEVWVYTHYLKKCYIRSGVDEKKVFTVPLGTDPEVFNPECVPSNLLRELSEGRYCFFFNGGVTLRKGADILVNAYLNEFKASDPVCLVIKDSCAYGKNLAAQIEALSKRSDIARLIYLNVNVDHFELPGLYTACDCYIHPYRAEGYGLPIVEALACGKPVIVTGGGSCLDFVEPDMGYFVKCSIEHMKEKRVSSLETVDYPFWFVPEIDHLQKVMRYVYEHCDAVREKGKKSGELVRLRHNWTRAAKLAEERFYELAGGYKIEDGKNSKKGMMLDYAVALLKENNFNDAAELFTIVLQNYGDNSICYEGLGLVAFQQKRYSDSFEYFKIANRLNPSEPEIILNWYEAALRTGRVLELKEFLHEALSENSNNQELINLAQQIGIL